MDVRRISYFMRVAEDGSLTKASHILRIAQPALSRQIRLLEEELGVTLFTRNARGMALTEAGEQFLGSVAGPMRELELAFQNVRASGTRAESNFAIGLSTNLGPLLAGPLTQRLDAGLPHVKLRIVEGPNGSLIDWLNRGLIDLALLEEAPRHERLFDRELLAQDLLLVGWRLDGEGPIGFRAAMQLPLIVPSHHLGIRSTINDASGKTRVIPNIRYEVDSARLALELAREGKGYCILPRLFLQDAGDLSIRRIVDPLLPFRVIVSVRRHMENSTAGRVGVMGHVVDAVEALLAAFEGEGE